MRFGFRLFRLLWNLTGNSAVVLPRCRERYDPYNIQSRSFETPRDLAVRRLTAQWIETLVSIKKCWSMFGIFLYCWNHENCHPHLVKSFFSKYVLTNTDFLFFFLMICSFAHVDMYEQNADNFTYPLLCWIYLRKQKYVYMYFFHFFPLRWPRLVNILPRGRQWSVFLQHDDVIKWKYFRVTGPLCGEFTGQRWIPLTKASDADLWCFLWTAPSING